MRSTTSTLQDTNSVLNNISSTVISLLCWFFLTACSTTNEIKTFTPSAAEPDEAIVYIYRPSEMANALYSPSLSINDEFKLYAKNSVSSRLSLAPGEYRFEFQPEKKYSDLTPLTLHLDAGTLYFVRVSSSLNINKMTTYEPYVRSFKLILMNEQQAIKEIAECCTSSNKKTADETKTDPTKNNTGDGFSVDKTQNPFSH